MTFNSAKGALRGRLHPALPGEGATRAPIEAKWIFRRLMASEMTGKGVA